MPQLEMYQAIANSPSTTLAIGINDTETHITLTDASVLPNAPNLLVLLFQKIVINCILFNI